MKKSLSTMLAVLMVVSMAMATGCNNPSGGSGELITINVMNTGGGVGRVWLDEAIKRYQDENPNVSIEVEHNIQTGVETMGSSGYHLYFVEDNGTVLELAAENKLLDITDVVTTKDETRDGVQISVLDKVDESYRFAMQGGDGKYYALPHFTFFPGLTYDAELFDLKGYYIADYSLSATETKPFTCKFGSANFVKDANTKKSLGNDGIPNTADDGLPSSLVEFLVLCSKLKSEGVVPFELNGRSKHYISYLIRSIWTSLSGYETMSGTYTYDKEMEIVTGDVTQSTELLFSGVNYIKKPITQKVTLTEETGYLAYDNVNRYYATMLVEILNREGWLSTDSTGNATHIDAQSNFVFGGNRGMQAYGMLIEGSYWYNESVDNYVMEDFYDYTDKSSRNIKWMPLPTSFDKPVKTAGEGREFAMIDACGNSLAFINNNIKEDETLVQACKDFLRFLYTDAELSHFVGATGVLKAALDFEVLSEDEERLSPFQKSVIDVYESGRLLYSAAENTTFRLHANELAINGGHSTLKPQLGGIAWNNYLDCIRGNHTAAEIFENVRFDKTEWLEYYYEG